ncbi:PREDICTED: glutaredoxin-like protein C5orf63 homolog [Amphimedon queenslandica]|uniref:Glutaredoxin-like protein n=1 Tax=Amphimedon queenslandica TaxID=400682 RepID=A0A1X7UM43_AMPQE|nr:PREDICTED: glutaredoxin-like protein C5orf63 homolog [Amphimedon queenslandica]|eukprot:XP_011404529.1 PREDICTED: glutaredoxin-like protein C5orf63 homolog [Amphimedon queenslandica]
MAARFLSSFSRQLPVLTFFTKQGGCSLCEEARTILDKYKDQFVYEEVCIDTSEGAKWYEAYKHDIPVLHINGRYLMKHRINEDKLLEALSSK